MHFWRTGAQPRRITGIASKVSVATGLIRLSPPLPQPRSREELWAELAELWPTVWRFLVAIDLLHRLDGRPVPEGRANSTAPAVCMDLAHRKGPVVQRAGTLDHCVHELTGEYRDLNVRVLKRCAVELPPTQYLVARLHFSLGYSVKAIAEYAEAHPEAGLPKSISSLYDQLGEARRKMQAMAQEGDEADRKNPESS